MYLPETYKITNYEIIFTMGCNLSCSYCYEKHESKTPASNTAPMSSQVMDATIAFIKASYDKKTAYISLAFFGGEPFLYFAQLQEFIEKFETMLSTLPKKTTPRYSATTNLVLPTTTHLDYLLKKKFSLLVSLDGDEVSHTLSRGQDSFYNILNNISYVQSRGMSLNTSMTVTKENLAYFRNNIIFLNMLGPRFRWKINTADTFTPEDMLTILEALRWLSAHGYLEQDESLAKIKGYAQQPGPCIDPHQTISISPEGNLLICSRVNWIIGTVTEGIVKYSDVEKLPLYSGEYHADCVCCPALKYCRGGCLGEHIEETGKHTVEYRLCKNSCIMHKLMGIFLEEQKLAYQVANKGDV